MPPINILIKPASSLCNMRCKYCFYSDVANSRAVSSYGIMTLEKLSTLVERVLDYADDFAVFSFQGGEPTLAGLDFFRELIVLQDKYNKKKVKISNSLQTNGYVIDDEWAEFFAKNGFLIGLSLDGCRDTHDYMRKDISGEGTFDRVIRAAETLRRHAVEFNVLCTVNNFVARHPKRIYAALKPYGFVQFIACLDPLSGEKRDYSLTNERYGRFLVDTFNEYYADFLSGKFTSVRNFDNYVSILMGVPPESCAMQGVCSCYFVCESDGSVYPCDFYTVDEWRLGNIESDSFGEMLRSDRAKRFVLSSKSKPNECVKCKYFSLCRGGCRREREPSGVDGVQKNTFCEAYYTFFENCFDKLTDMARKISAMRGGRK